jgi:hypothetical protein
VRPSGAPHALTIVRTTLPQAKYTPEQEYGLQLLRQKPSAA